MTAGKKLTIGQEMPSSNDKCVLCMQFEGNLACYRSGKYDGTFNNFNDAYKNGDKACYGGYYYVPSNNGTSSYTLKVTLTLKKDGQVTDSSVLSNRISNKPIHKLSEHKTLENIIFPVFFYINE